MRLRTFSSAAAKWFKAKLLQLGKFRITLVRAGHYWWDGGAVFGVVPKTLWQRATPADEYNRVALAFNCYLIETPANTVLLETGGGHQFTASQRERMNLPELVPLTDLLREHRVDTVINSHLHWDHCSGNMVEGEAAFPWATYYAPSGEYQYAHQRNSRDAVSYIDANYDPLVASCRMELVQAECEIVPGISVHAAPGHTRDLVTVTATSEGQTFCFLSDLVPTVQHLKPTWIAAFDLDPLTAIGSKTRILTKAARQQWWLGFGHDMNWAFARIDTEFQLQETCL